MRVENPESGNVREQRKELNEGEKEAAIRDTHTIEQLYSALDEIGAVQGSEEIFDTEQLKDKINRLRSGVIDLNYITRTYGLRDTVEKLLQSSNSPEAVENIQEGELPDVENVQQDKEKLAEVQARLGIRSHESGLNGVEKVHNQEAAPLTAEQELEDLKVEINSRNEKREEISKRIDEIIGELSAKEIMPFDKAAIKEYSGQLSEEFDELSESFKKDTLSTVKLRNERLSIYSSNPELVLPRLIELELKSLRKQVSKDPAHREEFLWLGYLVSEDGRKGLEYYEGSEFDALRDIYQPRPRDGEMAPWRKEAGEILRQELMNSTQGREQIPGTKTNPPETKESIIPAPELLRSELSYQDIPLPEEQKRSMLEFSEGSESANKYAESLSELSAGAGGIENVRSLARTMQQQATEAAAKLE